MKTQVTLSAAKKRSLLRKSAAPASPLASLPKGAVQKIGTALTVIAAGKTFNKKTGLDGSPTAFPPLGRYIVL